MILKPFARSTLAIPALLAFFACSGKTAEVELNSARSVLDQARTGKARDCASETFIAAETAMKEAARLDQQGETERAAAKAKEAETLAKRAIAASPEDCDEATPQIGEPRVVESEPSVPPPDLESLLETIYFDYNEAAIREDSKLVLSRIADLMSKKPDLTLEVEGHCDIRGSTEYNLHLGERRARSVRRYLQTQGVAEHQIRTISYGEERPADLGFSEAAHSANRRAELRKK